MKRVIIPGPPGTGKTYHLTNYYLRKELEELLALNIEDVKAITKNIKKTAKKLPKKTSLQAYMPELSELLHHQNILSN